MEGFESMLSQPAPPDTHLRPATPADALCLSVLATQVFLDTYASDGIDTDLANEARSVYAESVFSARLARPGVRLLVAERRGRLIAFADLALDTACPAAGIEGLEVFRLYVQAPFHGQGIGRALMAQAEQQARLLGRASVWLTAWSGNHKALAFYARLGFADVGATAYVIEGRAYENRILAKQFPAGAG